ncbi:hypothetical protein BT63DRAFT_420827 [Microthyrium microscopicum]|uniref:P-loop containing nucleoside triphosphate hydrolase protein n=1 Tax=Microthyrium microscopicum TaxID=703497 RepID=A0A6A6UM65_9PEZI|nr:hypothetical protein BT63DRAFT_420827 [Microthyrium microscopicum]
MASKDIFLATHPRACSTAFERVFMTCRDRLACVHEPFGDAWYFGPERLSDRFEDDEAARKKTGFSETTYGDIFGEIEKTATQEGKRVFIKDMAQYWLPLPSKSDSVSIAPSLVSYRRGVGTTNGTTTNGTTTNGTANGTHDEAPVIEPGNPTVVPDDLLRKYHFTFLIRHPRSSVPSYFRCTIPPLSSMTGFDYYDPVEAGYKELRMLFDYLVKEGHVGPKIAGTGNRTHYPENGTNGHGIGNGINGNVGVNGTAVANGDDAKVEICVIDADDLLDAPFAVVEAYCKSIGLKYDPGMLKWDDDENQAHAKQKKAPKSEEELEKEWTAKFGTDSAKVMLQTMRENVADFEYLQQFALKI